MDTEGPSQTLLMITQAIQFESMNVFGLVFLFLLLLLSGIVSGSEAAFFSITAENLSELKNSTKKKDLSIISLLEDPKRLLATILIFNNFINVAIVTLSTVLTWSFFGQDNSNNIILTVVSLVVTFFIVFIGEIIPKVYANQQNIVFARRTVGIIKVASLLFKPLSVILIRFSGIFEKRIKRKGYNISAEELSHVVDITAKQSTDEEKDIIKGVLNFAHIHVKQIMKNRIDITAIEDTDNFHQLMDKINKTGYSRIPVYTGRIDQIRGILYVKDILPFINQDENFAWQKLLRSCYFIPETKKIDVLLRNFQEKRVHIAIVVDEYGGTSGLITMEDIIEEIVGEINDEFDIEDIKFKRIDQDTYIFEGKTSINDITKILDINPYTFDQVKGESESLGGLLLELNSSIPNVGEKITYNQFEFHIMAVNSKRIKSIKMKINEPEVNEN